MSRSALERPHIKKPIIPPPPPMPTSTMEPTYYPPYPVPYMPNPAANYFQTMPGNFAPYPFPQQTAGQYPIPNMHNSNLMPQQFLPISFSGSESHDNDDPTTSNALPIHGNKTNFNINNLLFNNVLEFEYFRALYQLRTYHEVIDEVYASVKHVEPWQTGTTRIPSTAFCLLVKFLLMKLTLKQMNGLLSTDDCPYLRAIGFLYLRYTSPPTDLWKWFEPYLEDMEEIQPSCDKSIKMTMGEYCIKLLTDMQYFGTTLPRIPVPIERKMKVMLLLLTEKQRRRRNNLRVIDQFIPGATVRAIYGDDKNEPAWYDAVIDSIDVDTENKYWVTFPEYGNQECVDLGDMELPTTTTSHEIKKDGTVQNSTDEEHSRHRSRSRDRENHQERRDDDKHGGERLIEKVLKSERDASAAVGRNYGHRPASYKGSLSLRMDRYTMRKKSPDRRNGGINQRTRGRSRSNSPHPNKREYQSSSSSSTHKPSDTNQSSSATSGRGNQMESNQEQQSRLKMLRDRYGDASAN